jgi:2-keto-4-pentenoate hydratase/2-oxohepta-3-ene-1,7-dioic acid hydratase in catechol pathway
MKLMRFFHEGHLRTGIVRGSGVFPVDGDLLTIVQSGALPKIPDCEAIPLTDVTPHLPYDVPPKIWCIGLNYKSHAEDIKAVQPEEPASFMKPASCMFQPGGEIVLPPPEVSNDVDAEGELGVLIGRRCRFLSREDAPSAIFGYTTTLDLTALDVLAKNPRYLFHLRPRDRNRRRGGRYRVAGSGHGAQRRRLFARFRESHAPFAV